MASFIKIILMELHFIITKKLTNLDFYQEGNIGHLLLVTFYDSYIFLNKI
jgi:hypothetical protein